MTMGAPAEDKDMTTVSMRRKKQKGVGISFVKVTRKLRLKSDSHTDTLELFHLA